MNTRNEKQIIEMSEMDQSSKNYERIDFTDVIPKTETLLTRLAAVRKSLKKVTKGNNNPYFNSKYADLNTIIDALEPLLLKNDLLLLQPIEDNKVISRVIDIESGDFVESSLTLPSITDPQKMIAACTYYRRATLQSLFVMQAVDDDGNTAREATESDSKPKLTEKQIITAIGYLKSGKRQLSDLLSKYDLTTKQIQTLKLAANENA